MRVALDNEPILRNTAKRTAAERSSTVGDIVLEVAHAGHLAHRRSSKWCLTPFVLDRPTEASFRHGLKTDGDMPRFQIAASERVSGAGLAI